MKKTYSDNICAKLLKKKSNGYLKLSLIIFLVSIIISSIGLLYSRQYFQYEKDFIQNVTVRTVTVDSSYKDGRITSIEFDDIENIKQLLSKSFSTEKIDTIPTYTLCSGVYMNSIPLNVIAIEESEAYLIGIDNLDYNTAYFINDLKNNISLDVCMLTQTENGFESNRLEQILLNSRGGVYEKNPILINQSGNIPPSITENQTCFIGMKTFYNIISVISDKENLSINELIDMGIASIGNVYVVCDDLVHVSDVSTQLTTNNYGAYAPTDAFDNFSETVSVTFMVFLITSIVLLIMTTVNILLSFSAFYRVQQKDMGILKYMGFDDGRIFKIYYKNLAKSFIQIIVFTITFILIVGMFLFSFSHWLVLSLFALLLIVFLSTIYFIILKTIILRYVRQDFITLIRESKEFE